MSEQITKEAIEKAIADIRDIRMECTQVFASEKKSLDLAEVALRQMYPTEPCDWCADNDWELTLILKKPLPDGWIWIDRVNALYCPNCGRRLAR